MDGGGTSDGAAQALQARDMLAGNWLLHGWTLSDVSFYTTELPEYVLVELVRPFGAGVIHVAAAVTYTLLVLAWPARSRGVARAGRKAWSRRLLAAGIMLAPQLGYGAFVLLLSPDHVGTQVPLLLGWLLLDRARPAGGAASAPEATGAGLRSPGCAAAACARLGCVAGVAAACACCWPGCSSPTGSRCVTAVLPLVLVCAVP